MKAQDNGLVSISCTFLVPPELVFDAWTKPDLVRKWLFVGTTSEIINIELDLKTAGKFSMVELEKTSNEHIEHYGQYTLIDAPKKLAFTLSVPKHFPGETAVTITIEPLPEGSELKLVQIGVPGDVTEESWKKMFEQLKLTLEVG